ncbi:hypothetical protein M5K25_014883 [Dendrobium thyrsiflorum]|uniref:Uncharacterized protein n=1 Tax=Dendrobium thyrsiflorum TaxID=117978 RepID=A0ABD0UPN3_DENTH
MVYERLVNELIATAGINLGDGYSATTVVTAEEPCFILSGQRKRVN